MRHFRHGAALFAAACLAALPAFADEPISYTGPIILPTGVTAQGKIQVSPGNPLPVTSSSALSPWSKDSFAAVTLSPTTSTSSATQLTGTGTVVSAENIGAVDVYALTSASSGVQAATTDVVVHPGQVVALPNLGYISAITASGTGALRITTGTGDPRPAFSAGFNSPSVVAGEDGATAASVSNPQRVAAAASATGGCTPYGYPSSASTNATNIKNAAGTLCSLSVVNSNSTAGSCLRLYDLSTTPTPSSATGYILSLLIPAATTVGGIALPVPASGWKFSNGIGFVITGGCTSTDNTNAQTGVQVIASYK